MKKNKFAAALLIAVLSLGTAAVPCGTFDTAITASAETALSAPKNIKTVCGDGELIVSWDKVSGAAAYKIAVKKPSDNDFKTFKTVYDTFVRIPDISDGDKVMVRITPLKKSGENFKAGPSVKITKTFKGKKAYFYDNLFVFDISLFGKTQAQVEKALGKKLKLQKWEWWTDADGNELKIAFVSLTKDAGMALLFDKDKKLIQAFSDLPVDEYNNSLKAMAKKFYGTRRDIMSYVDNTYKDSGRILFYDRYDLKPDGINFDMRCETYADDGDMVMRQEYFIYDRLFKD